MTAIPKSVGAAARMLERYAELDGQLAVAEARRSNEIARANADADANANPIIKQLGDIAAALEPWWPSAAAEIAGGKKSVELGGCFIGTRLSRPKLKHGFDSDDKAVDALRETRHFRNATKVKYSLDRTATLKLLQLDGKAAADLKTLGFSIDQTDTFFVERAEQTRTLASEAR